MTPREFGKLVKLAAETGGFGEFLGQGFDRGVQHVNRAIGMPEISPQAWGGGGAQTVPTPAGAPKPSKYKDPSQMPGPSAAAPMPAAMAAPPAARPSRYRDPSQMPGPSTATPAARPAPAPAPRPAAARPAPAQPRPTSPGVRKPPGRVA